MQPMPRTTPTTDPPDILTLRQVRDRLTRRVAMLGTLKAAADAIGVSPTYYFNVMKGKIAPGPLVLKGLNLKREIRYVEAA